MRISYLAVFLGVVVVQLTGCGSDPNSPAEGVQERPRTFDAAFDNAYRIALAGYDSCRDDVIEAAAEVAVEHHSLRMVKAEADEKGDDVYAPWVYDRVKSVHDAERRKYIQNNQQELVDWVREHALNEEKKPDFSTLPKFPLYDKEIATWIDHPWLTKGYRSKEEWIASGVSLEDWQEKNRKQMIRKIDFVWSALFKRLVMPHQMINQREHLSLQFMGEEDAYEKLKNKLAKEKSPEMSRQLAEYFWSKCSLK